MLFSGSIYFCILKKAINLEHGIITKRYNYRFYTKYEVFGIQ